jgi:hypothetical protein
LSIPEDTLIKKKMEVHSVGLCNESLFIFPLFNSAPTREKFGKKSCTKLVICSQTHPSIEESESWREELCQVVYKDDDLAFLRFHFALDGA